MPHPLVQQLRFTRSEFVRGLEGVTPEDAGVRMMPMNSIGWIVGHLAAQEQRYWLTRAQGKTPFPGLDEIAGYGNPPTTPPVDEMWETWRAVTGEANLYLDSLTTESLQEPLVAGSPLGYSAGSYLQRQIYHYWYHLGESLAIRQMLGHVDLPEYVGDIESQAPYRPD